MKKLNAQRERFCREYIGCMNAARAATAAGYGAKGARVAGQRLLRDELVQKRLDELRWDVTQACDFSAAMMVNVLKKIVLADITDMHNEWADMKDLTTVPKELRGAIREVHSDTKMVDGNMKQMVKVKFYDKLGAIDRLIKILVLHADPKFRSGTNGSAQPVASLIPRVVVIENPHFPDLKYDPDSENNFSSF